MFQPENNFLKQLSGFGGREGDTSKYNLSLEAHKLPWAAACTALRKFLWNAAPKISQERSG